MHVVQKRLVRLFIAGGVLTGAIGAPLLLAAGTAEAAGTPGSSTCGTSGTPGTTCSLIGTLGLTGGLLTLTGPTALTWSATESGLNLALVDATTAHQSYVVSDATGLGLGWHVTVSATTFQTSGGALTLPSNSFSTNGSTTSISNTTTPPFACTTGATCTTPTDTTAYPVTFTTAASPTASNIFDDSAATGIGSVTIGPVGWWLNIPANQGPGTYTSTITMQILSTP